MGGMSKNQKKIMELLQIKPDMTTKEIAELIFGRIVSYKSKEFASIHRSLISLERQGYIQRVQVQLRWRVAAKTKSEDAPRLKE
jgi:DNA-binding MarR family transcriptional regulator